MTIQRAITLWLLTAGSISSSSAYAQVQIPAPPSKPGATAPAPAKPVTVPAPAQKPTASQPPTRQQLEQLARLQERALAVFDIPGVVFTDVNERTGRFEVGVVNAGVGSRARARLIELGIPANIIDVVITKPIIYLQSLTDRTRPLQGGLQILFRRGGGGGVICTLGFNAVRAAVPGFVTNSHCTSTQGGVEGTIYHQAFINNPIDRPPVNLIGIEEVDPLYRSGGSCPAEKRCRFSDSAWVRLARDMYGGLTYVEVPGGPPGTPGSQIIITKQLQRPLVPGVLGAIAKTASPNTGSLTITGSFRIVGEAIAELGTTANKVGLTSGWSQGSVTAIGVNLRASERDANGNIVETNIVLRNQVFVAATAAPGDSGAPVFRIESGNDVSLLGILCCGSPENTNFVYSPIANVQRSDELGPLIKCASGFNC